MKWVQPVKCRPYAAQQATAHSWTVVSIPHKRSETASTGQDQALLLYSLMTTIFR